MLKFALSLRFVMLVASFGAALGALVLFWEGSAHMISAIAHMLGQSEAKRVIAEVMGASTSTCSALSSSFSPTPSRSASSSI